MTHKYMDLLLIYVQIPKFLAFRLARVVVVTEFAVWFMFRRGWKSDSCIVYKGCKQVRYENVNLFRQTTITTINRNQGYGVYKYALYMQILNVYNKYIVNNLN
jgi:hypothetical protein